VAEALGRSRKLFASILFNILQKVGRTTASW